MNMFIFYTAYCYISAIDTNIMVSVIVIIASFTTFYFKSLRYSKWDDTEEKSFPIKRISCGTVKKQSFQKLFWPSKIFNENFVSLEQIYLDQNSSDNSFKCVTTYLSILTEVLCLVATFG